MALSVIGKYIEALPESTKDKKMLIEAIRDANGGCNGIYQQIVRLNSLKAVL